MGSHADKSIFSNGALRYCPKISNNSLIRDEKSNKHIANGYKKLVHTFKREAVQFFVAKNLAVNHLPLEALPAVQT